MQAETTIANVPAATPNAPSAAGAEIARDREGKHSPPDTRDGKGFERTLVSAGATAFALPYLASALAATTGYDKDDGGASSRAALWLPAVGPFIALGQGDTALTDALLLLDGLAQVGGLTLFVYELASPAAGLVRDPREKTVKISIGPLLVRGAPGAALVAAF